MRSDTERGTPHGGRFEHADEASSPRHRSRRRAFIISATILLAIAAVLGMAFVWAMLDTRDDLQRGRAALERGRRQLLLGDAEAAATSFRDGRRSFVEAQQRADDIAILVVGWLPFLGRTSDATDAIAEAAVATADPAILLADAAADIPGGLPGLGPTNGRIVLDRFTPLARAAAEADELMSRAVARLERAPTSLVLGPVGSARREAETDLSDLSASIHTTSLLLDGLPGFLGADGPRRYFFGAQNPAELRGTGGLIGAYSILEIDDGRFSFLPFASIHGLSRTPLKDLPAPNEDYARNYEQFRRGGRFWTSINIMPDFPSVARAILSSYEAATGEKLDGVMLADPFAEKAMLAAAGPVDLPGYDVEVDAKNVVDFTTNEAYSLFTDSDRRKRVLGDVATAVVARFLNQPSADAKDLRELLRAAAARHLQIFSTDPLMQQGLNATPVGGALRPHGADDDLVSVIVNSGAGSKVDFYQRRTIDYSVYLDEDGSAAARLDLTLRNEAPTSGQPAYVIGPFRRHAESAGSILQDLEAGESVALVNVYCGTDCVPLKARMDGSPETVTTDVDLGVRFIRDYYAIKSGDRRALQLEWEDPNAWDGNGSGGVYRMTFANQVTINPTELRLRIDPPEGMRISSASAPLRVVDGAALYEGRPGARVDAVVEFKPSLPVRLWRDLVRFLNTPVFSS
jgi:Protein of unknown function (DUF4012)